MSGTGLLSLRGIPDFTLLSCRLSIKTLEFLVVKMIFSLRLLKGPAKKGLISLFFHLLSAQLEEQHNYEETPMYLNQSGDTTTLCVIEGTLQSMIHC